MIAYLEGKLRHKSPEYLVLDVQGVGYCVHVPLSTFYELPEPGRTAALNIHTHVREDLIQLYGFRTSEEKEMFLHLITINGVGPRLALAILSGIHCDELRRAVAVRDGKRLRNIPGIGKKIAERILLELRDRLKIKEDLPPADSSIPQGDHVYADAFSALANLGYRPAEADRALAKAKKALGEDPALETLLKEALRVLA